jgi:hypothetical protein
MKFGITLQLRGNLLILYREIVAVYCENHIKHTDSVGKLQSYLMLKQVVYIDHIMS